MHLYLQQILHLQQAFSLVDEAVWLSFTLCYLWHHLRFILHGRRILCLPDDVLTVRFVRRSFLASATLFLYMRLFVISICLLDRCLVQLRFYGRHRETAVVSDGLLAALISQETRQIVFLQNRQWILMIAGHSRLASHTQL